MRRTNRPPSTEQSGHHRRQFDRMQRLLQVFGTGDRCDPLASAGVAEAGYEYDGNVTLRPQPPGKFDAVEVRQADVEDGQSAGVTAAAI